MYIIVGWQVFFFFCFVFFLQQLMATSRPSYWCYGTMATKKVCLNYRWNIPTSNLNMYFFALYKKLSILKRKTFPNVKVVRRIIAHRCL